MRDGAIAWARLALGVLVGGAPLLYGLQMRLWVTAPAGFVGCVVAAFFFGLLGAIAVAALFLYIEHREAERRRRAFYERGPEP